jgi:hypothetical protein
MGVKGYSHEVSGAYVFRMPMAHFTPFVLEGGHGKQRNLDRHIHVRLDGTRPPRKIPAAPPMGVPEAGAMLTKFAFSCGPQTEEYPTHFLIRYSIDADLFSQVLSRVARFSVLLVRIPVVNTRPVPAKVDGCASLS